MQVRRAWAITLGLILATVVAGSLASPSHGLVGESLGNGGLGGGGLVGSASLLPQTRIVGGVAADRAETGWFMQFTPKVGGQTSLCAATAISARWALTAAHCVTTKQGRHKIRAATGRGESYLQTNPGTRNTGTRHWIDRIVINPGYTFGPLHWNDLALLRTTSRLVAPALTLNANPSAPAVGTLEQVYGFGTTEDGNYSSMSSMLRIGSVKDLTGPGGTCGTYGEVYNGVAQLCAGIDIGGIDSCQGDSGGPLIATVDGVRSLVGVVSSGEGCAKPEYPGLYARVSTYTDWIDRTINPQPSWLIRWPCVRQACSVRSGTSLSMTIKNRSVVRGRWWLTTDRTQVRVSRTGGNIRGGRTVTVHFDARNDAPSCVPVTFRAVAQAATTYFLRINGGRCT